MPPITEKQRSTSILKGNVKENNFPPTTPPPATAVAAANTITTVTPNKQQQLQQQQPLSDKIENHHRRVPEIIDFRDSWLQEIEMYKDQIKVQQQQQFLLIQQHHHHHNHQGHNFSCNDGTTATPASIVAATITAQQQPDDMKNSISDSVTTTTRRRVRSRSDSADNNHYENHYLQQNRRMSNESEDDGGRAREDNNSMTNSSSTSSSSPKSRHDTNITTTNRHHTKIRNHKRKSPSPVGATTASSTLSSSQGAVDAASITKTQLLPSSPNHQVQQLHGEHSSTTKTSNGATTVVATMLPKTLTTTTNHHCHHCHNNNHHNTGNNSQQQNSKTTVSHQLPNNCCCCCCCNSLSPHHHQRSCSSLITNQQQETKATTGVVTCSKTQLSQQQSSKVIKTSTTVKEKAAAKAVMMNGIGNVCTKLTTTNTSSSSSTNGNTAAIVLKTSLMKSGSSIAGGGSSGNSDVVVGNSTVVKDGGSAKTHQAAAMPNYMAVDYNENDEDDIIGGIDETDIYDESSENDDDDCDEYLGQPYYIYPEEEQQKFMPDTTNSNDHQHYYGAPQSILSPSLFPNVPPYLNFSTHEAKGPPIPNEIQKLLKWKSMNFTPKIVRRVVTNSGFRLIKKPIDWMGTWEKHMKAVNFKTIRSHQKFNHLPGSFKIGRKDSLWRNLHQLMPIHGKKEFGFMPKTYILPHDLDDLKKVWPKYARKNTKWIIKPPASARGTGIKVINRWSQIPKSTPIIVQKYIEKPLLIVGSKFDLRLYVIITSINPLRIFMHTDGLARFASVQYSDKLDTINDRCMHLTNYSINKLSSNYAKNEDINACSGHKWRLNALWKYFNERNINTKRLWATIRNLVIRTVISGEGCLNKIFKQNVGSKYNCYELFGFDIILDENLIPWLLEVNISPSLHSDMLIDQSVKGPLMQAILNTALYQVPPKLPEHTEKQILKEYNLNGRLCYDKRIYTACLSPEEARKHAEFTNRSTIEEREDYIDTILDDLTPDDIRCLIVAEDELARSSPLERIFPSSESYKYLQFIDGPRYYNRLLDAWETKFSKNRSKGIQLLQNLCEKEIHLQVPPNVLSSRDSEERIAKFQQENAAADCGGTTATSATYDLSQTDSSLSIATSTTTANFDDDDNNKIATLTNLSNTVAATESTTIVPTSTTSSNVASLPSPQKQPPPMPPHVSCSKEAAAIALSGGSGGAAATATIITTDSTENQLNGGGPRPIVVRTQ